MALAETVLDWGNAFKSKKKGLDGGVESIVGQVYSDNSNSKSTVFETTTSDVVDQVCNNAVLEETTSDVVDQVFNNAVLEDTTCDVVGQVCKSTMSEETTSDVVSQVCKSIASEMTTIQQSKTVFPPPSPAWETGRFALEVQSPWSKRLISGEKTIETRSYPLPAGLLGRPIEVMESQPGSEGVSTLGDTIEAFTTGLSVVGRVVFSRSEAYSSREAWEADESRHLVPLSSVGYGWKGPESRVYGWTVAEVEAFSKPRAVRPMRRAFRSLFKVDSPRNVAANGNSHDDGGGNAKRKSKNLKKKRKRKRPAVADVGGEGGAAAAQEGGKDDVGSKKIRKIKRRF